MQIVSPRLAQTAPMTPLEFGAPAAWYDASAAGSLLDASNVAVSAFGKIATFKDTSGNSPTGERHLLQGTDGSRPLYLPWSGLSYGYTNTTGTTNYFSTPDATGPNSLRSSFTLTMRLTPATWTPADFMYLFSYGTEGGTLCCSAYMLSDGKVYFNSSKNGSTYATTAESDALGFSAGQTGYVRITRSTGGPGKIYKSANGTDWTDVTAAMSSSSGTLYNTTGDFILSGYSATAAYSVSGGTDWMTVHAGYDSAAGALALYFNPSQYINGSAFTASTGEVWTLNGNALIVARAGALFDGSNDYMRSATFALAQPITVYLASAQITWTLNDVLIDGYNAASMYIYQAASTPGIKGLSTPGASAENAGWPLKSAACISGVYNGANSSLRVNRGTVTSYSTGTGAAAGLTLGAIATAGQPSNILVSELVAFSEAHTLGEQARMAAYLARKWRFTV